MPYILYTPEADSAKYLCTVYCVHSRDKSEEGRGKREELRRRRCGSDFSYLRALGGERAKNIYLTIDMLLTTTLLQSFASSRNT